MVYEGQLRLLFFVCTEINISYTICHISVLFLVFYLRLFAKCCVCNQKAVILPAIYQKRLEI